jgi:hypothetical protein
MHLRLRSALLVAESRGAHERNTIPATIHVEQPHSSVPGVAFYQKSEQEKQQAKSSRALYQCSEGECPAAIRPEQASASRIKFKRQARSIRIHAHSMRAEPSHANLVQIRLLLYDRNGNTLATHKKGPDNCFCKRRCGMMKTARGYRHGETLRIAPIIFSSCYRVQVTQGRDRAVRGSARISILAEIQPWR